MSTDTPITDDLVYYIDNEDGRHEVVDPDKCRQIERELNVAQRTIEKYEAALKKITTENYTMPEARFVASTALRA